MIPDNIPSLTYQSNADALKLILHSDNKRGVATTKADILFRYPYAIEPPPQEVSDFCLPLGGTLYTVLYYVQCTKYRV